MDPLPLIPERQRARSKYAKAVGSMRWPILLTLTRARRKQRLTVSALRDTMRAFARLRRTKAFSLVGGGVASLEVSGASEEWHDHIHAIVDAKWLDIIPLANAWKRALKGKGTVHVQRIKSPIGALHYVTKPHPGDLEKPLRAGYFITAWGTCK